jgi:hypothetical protein
VACRSVPPVGLGGAGRGCGGFTVRWPVRRYASIV